MVIKSPFITEKVTNMIDSDNTMEFLVDIRASKKEIKRELEEIYNVEVVSIRTMITPKGGKKASVKLAGEGSANELATTLGLL
ncbi:50S ribosomal protein L23 [Candidatus Methanocrinis natronophilus]|uniref:Large ribosomal subunit protein uL23 n=1 Tax=Candidatus Methanocrinis natronophilus TaxID=3033396 RepID=A0ABT5X865_9EURY|nr:50S ribosomal protein L23 [Candidatus Methanocrinis natronophilus]MDF0590887.1 50S ribosomal protein L23 [Candidatus Methanocrinis natronophilus]